MNSTPYFLIMNSTLPHFHAGLNTSQGRGMRRGGAIPYPHAKCRVRVSTGEKCRGRISEEKCRGHVSTERVLSRVHQGPSIESIRARKDTWQRVGGVLGGGT